MHPPAFPSRAQNPHAAKTALPSRLAFAQLTSDAGACFVRCGQWNRSLPRRGGGQLRLGRHRHRTNYVVFAYLNAFLRPLENLPLSFYREYDFRYEEVVESILSIFGRSGDN
jgi:hypothetical protein